ncbi:hypothetical protein BRARA_F03883 [Brassica rapa]|uniref:Late embryogenesis abundant protein LEA-2 subgroup domain-containing protein n=1 Tax=Brassica campestris TaxID=3711 RepID=A0A397ZEL8_BRACM|nr:hypothetical protein BRARA_F03883 [Brassica rapa]
MSSATFEERMKLMCPNMTPEEIAQQKKVVESCIGFLLVVICFLILLSFVPSASTPNHNLLEIKIVSMDFTAEPNNNNKNSTQQSHYLPLVSARWDLLIRVPGELVGNNICLQGNLQASFLYKNVTLVTSSLHSYNELELGAPQLLTVSAVATGEDLSGAIGKEIMEAIKERNEIQFGSRLSLTDCREETKKGTVGYECDEAKLRFDHLGSDQIKATAFGEHPTCIIKE